MNGGQPAAGTPKAECIAARAISQVGVAFKLHGRVPGEALDCVGLIGFAITPYLANQKIPVDYKMAGEFTNKVTSYLNQAGFVSVATSASWQTGDIILAQAGPRQQHLLICGDGGFVHAHAGLRRVVWTPGPLPWPQLDRWRIEEN